MKSLAHTSIASPEVSSTSGCFIATALPPFSPLRRPYNVQRSSPLTNSQRQRLHCRLASLRPVAVASSENQAAAVSSAENSLATQESATALAPAAVAAAALGVEVKLVAVGTRGAAALQKLLSDGKSLTNVKDVWCLDVDKKVLDSVSFAQGVLIPKENSGDGSMDGNGVGPLSAEDLAAIVGRTASDAGGRGNIGSADGGVAFVLAPAAAIPGGSALLLQLVSALRAAGHFTVAAVTAPFNFEGNAKAEQARAVVNALEERAHLVAVMEQEVLLQAFGESQLTVAEATDIADNALEHTARCVLQAVQAQEILKSSRGALMWHGRDLRHYKRLLSPPLQQLLTCPGTAVLGRGLAALPSATAHSMGPVKALMHLASEAVLAAADSPFLDGALDNASAVLCCINLPHASQAYMDATGAVSPFLSIQSQEGERHAIRMAAQASAGALRSITGRSCDDFVLCVEPKESEGRGDSASVQVEATLLVVRSPNQPALNNDNAQGGTFNNKASGINTASSSQTPGIITTNSTGATSSAPPRQPSKLSSSNWGMLSAMAGGATKDSTQQQSPVPLAPPSSQQQGKASNSAASFFGAGNKQNNGAKAAPQRQAEITNSQRAAASTSQPATASPQQEKDASSAVNRKQAKVTVGDYLAESLTAQSLDLPPAAAKWRQGQLARRTGRQRRLVVWEVDESEPWEEGEEEQGLAGLFGGKKERKVDIKQRVAGMLAQDREDVWDPNEEESDQR